MKDDAYLKTLVSRIALAQGLGQMHNGKRDVYDSCGWPLSVLVKEYFERYKRQGVAKRIIDAPVKATWRDIPLIEELETPGKETLFEQDVELLISKMRLYSHCAKVDRLAGLGEFAVLFLGLSDAASPIDLAQEVKKSKSNKLLYLAPYSQLHVDVKEYEEDSKNERYGLPKLYSVDFSRSSAQYAPGTAVPLRGARSIGKQIVHWSRLIHVVEDPIEGEIFASPRLECVWNNLLSLELITGGSGEMYWQGAFPGFGFRAQGDAEFGTEEREAMIEEIENYFHGLQRYLRLRGVDVDQLSPQVSDPSQHIDVQLTQISAATGIPKRILTGSERGELASSQDQENWLSRVDERRRDFAEHGILRPVLDRLISVEAITTPKKGYDVIWPDIYSLTEGEQIDLNSKRTTMLTGYVAAPGADTIVPPEIFLRDFMNLEENAIEECLKSIESAPEEPEEGLEPPEEEQKKKDKLVENVLTILENFKDNYSPDQPRHPKGSPLGGKFAPTGKSGGASGKSSSGSSSFNKGEWEQKDFGTRMNDWGGLSNEEKKAQLDAGHSVKKTIDGYLDGIGERPTHEDPFSCAKERLGQLSDRIPQDASFRIQDHANRVSSALDELGVDKETSRKVVLDMVDAVAAQEIESLGRTLGDHGARHILANAEYASQVASVVQGRPLTASERLELEMTAAYHDTGYLTPPAQIFLDREHPQSSVEHFKSHVYGDMEKILGKDVADRMVHTIGTHDGTEMDWKNDTLPSSMRLADNLALFQSEKLPGLFRYVPENVQVLEKLGRKEISLEEAQQTCLRNIETTPHISPAVKKQLQRATKEMNTTTPKFTLGMMGGKIAGVDWDGKSVRVKLERNQEAARLHKVLDLGQRQFYKFAETYGVDPFAFTKKNKFKFGQPPKLVVDIIGLRKLMEDEILNNLNDLEVVA